MTAERDSSPRSPTAAVLARHSARLWRARIGVGSASLRACTWSPASTAARSIRATDAEQPVSVAAMEPGLDGREECG